MRELRHSRRGRPWPDPRNAAALSRASPVDTFGALPYCIGMRTEKRPLVLGHRGFRARYPENTLLAFRQALDNRADGVECDIQKTSDGRYVVIHDPTTDRVTGAVGEVAKTSFKDLRVLDFGRGEKIPELSELLESIPPGSYLDLELKEETLTIEDCGPLAAMLDAHIPRQHLMVSSFRPQLLLPFRRRGFTVGFLVGEETAARGASGAPARPFSIAAAVPQSAVQLVEKLGPALAPASPGISPAHWVFPFSSGR